MWYLVGILAWVLISIHRSLHIAIVTKERSILDLWGFPDTLFLWEMTEIKNAYQNFSLQFLCPVYLFKFSLFRDWLGLLINRCILCLFTGCCFVTFYTRKAALDAQNALHNIKTMSGVSASLLRTSQCLLNNVSEVKFWWWWEGQRLKSVRVKAIYPREYVSTEPLNSFWILVWF